MMGWDGVKNGVDGMLCDWKGRERVCPDITGDADESLREQECRMHKDEILYIQHIYSSNVIFHHYSPSQAVQQRRVTGTRKVRTKSQSPLLSH